MDVSVQWLNKEGDFERHSFVDVEELFKRFPRDEAYSLSIDFDYYDRTFILMESKRDGKGFYSIYIEGAKPAMITLLKQLLSEINAVI